ncbi:MlaD family protein [Gordonia sp. CPCC 206044]|uniref:MlaD family protein n=1 Tax=Gordonia sp. CPCC 206044 TaxID=3140793 RepID=UPI003AF384C6
MTSSTAREFVVNVVIFVVVVAATSAYLATSVYHWRPWEESKTATLHVTGTDLVLSGTGVDLNGVSIGKVSHVRITHDGADLTVEYPGSATIPSNAGVEIGMQSALGEPYVNFVPGDADAPALPDGAVLDTDRVAEPESIPGIFDRISNLSAVTAADPVAGVLHTVWQSLDGNNTSLAQISDGSRLVAGLLLSREAQLRTMFTNTQVYTGDLDWLVKSLPQFGNGLGKVFSHFLGAMTGTEDLVYGANMRQTLVDIVHPFLARLNPYLREIVPTSVEALGPLMPIASAVNSTLPVIDVSDLLSRALELFGSGDSARFVIRPRQPQPR